MQSTTFDNISMIHFGKRAIVLIDPDGIRVLVQSPTSASPG